jgi:hypothetical protein
MIVLSLRLKRSSVPESVLLLFAGIFQGCYGCIPGSRAIWQLLVKILHMVMRYELLETSIRKD